MALLTVSLKERELGRYPLVAHMWIGRDPGCEIFIDNVGISRQHASVLFEEGKYLVSDNQSANGLYVNGEKVSRHYLTEGDVLQIGKFSLRFSVDGGLEPVSLSGGTLSGKAGREMLKTVALRPDEVQQLIRSSSDPPATQRLDEESESSLVQDQGIRLLVFGLLGIVALALIGYFLLIR